MNLIIAFFWTEAYYTWGRVLEKLISAQNEILISGWWRSQHVYKVEIMIHKNDWKANPSPVGRGHRKKATAQPIAIGIKMPKYHEKTNVSILFLCALILLKGGQWCNLQVTLFGNIYFWGRLQIFFSRRTSWEKCFDTWKCYLGVFLPSPIRNEGKPVPVDNTILD